MSERDAQPISTRVAKGAAWIFGFKLLERTLGFISTLILARLLLPADFGIIAMATSLSAMLALFSSFDFHTALIQKPDIGEADYNTAWTLNTILGAASSLAMVALASPLADFYREPQLRAVVLAIAPLPLLQNIYNIGLVEYRKRLEFHQDFWFQAIKKFAAFGLTVPLAFVMKSYWALVIGMLGGQLAGTIASYFLHPHRPRFTVSRYRSLVGFSIWTLIATGLTVARIRASHFVLGRLGGASALGFYAMATDITTLPTTEMVMPLNRAVFPAYSQMARNAESLKHAYLAVVGMIALIITPAAIGLIAVAEAAIPVLLGAAWKSSIPLIAPMAIFGLSLALQTNSSSIYWALGRPKLAAATAALMLMLLVVSVIPLTKSMGAYGTAIACLISGVLTLPLTFWLMARLLGIAWRDFVKVLWRPFGASAAMYVSVVLLFRMSGTSVPAALLLVLGLFAGAVTYVGGIAALWMLARRPDGAEAFLLSRLSPVLRKFERTSK